MQSPNQSGIALVIVLWVIALLAVIAVSFTTATRGQANLVRNLVENAKAEALADAGLYRAILGLLEPLSRQRLLERRPELEPVLLPEPGDTLGPETDHGWRVDGTVYVWPFGGGRVWVSIQDEGGKIDLNAAPDELLRGLFLSVGLDEDASAALVDAIVDFRDKDDLHRLNGAEDRDYADAGLPYGAKDAPFEAVEELQQVLGMTRQIYQRVAPALTVHSGRRGIDPRVAPRAALLALPGIGSEEVESFLAARAEGTTENLLGAQGHKTTSRERMFAIRAEAHAGSGAVFVREAIVEPIGARHKALPNPKQLFRFLAWKQGSRAAARDEATN